MNSKKDKNEISEAVIKRLPKYYRCLTELEEAGETRISSLTMAKILGFTASQVRQDLNNFGEFGQQGFGYEVQKLKSEIQNILGLTRSYNLIVVGGGNIGTALSRYDGFKNQGFFVKAVFDISFKTSQDVLGVLHMPFCELESYVKKNKVDVAVITVPKDVAQGVADKVVSLKVPAIWNFAPIELKRCDGVMVENINMSESLYYLSYKINSEHKV